MANNTSLYGSNGNIIPAGDNVIITGTLTVNGCSILTDCTAFNLLPFNANTLNIGLESTTLALGATSGVTTIRNQLATANYDFPVADGTANQVLITDGAGNLSFASASSLPGIVTSITGTANQVIASSPTGAVTLSLPQDIATTSNPVFAGVTGGNITVGIVDNQTVSTLAGNLTLDAASNLVAVTGDFYVEADTTLNTGTVLTNSGNVVLFNTTATTVNAFEAATYISMGANTGTTLINNNLNAGNGILYVDKALTRVGVNTTSPLYEVHINDAGDGLVQLGMVNTERTFLITNNAGDDLLSFYYGDTAPPGPYNRLQFNPTDQWFNTGRLGVGTNTPAHELDVQGTGRFTSTLIASGSFTLNGTTSGYSNFAQPAVAANIGYTLPAAQGAASTVLTNDGSGNLTWALPGGGGSTFGNISIGVVTDNTIASTDTNGDIIIQPNGSGDVSISADTLFIGDGGASASITTSGTGSLFLNTNNSVNSGSIGIIQGVNGTISLDPNGTGVVQVTKNLVVDGDIDVKGGGITNSTGNLAITGGVFPPVVTDPSPSVLTLESGQTTLSLNGGVGFDDSVLTLTNSGLRWDHSAGLVPGSVNGIWNWNDDGTTDFPNYTFPYADGAANEVLTTDGTGNIFWALPGGGGSTFGNITVGVVTDNTISTTTGDLVLASATNIIDASTTTITCGAYTVGTSGTIDNQATTTTSVTPMSIASTLRNGMKVVVSIVDNVTTARHMVEALLFRQGGNAYVTTYAEIYSSAALATFSADDSTGSLRLIATPVSTNSTTFEAIRTSIN